jgi:hypothetical protein
MRAHLKKALAFILLLTTVCSAFVGCFDLDDNGSYSDSDITDIATDGTSSSGTDKTDKTDETNETNGNTNENDNELKEGDIPIFLNGEYTAKVICSDTASDFERDIYDQIREILRKTTGKTPESATDYVVSGGEKYDGPAILIGETNYEESKQAYEKLANEYATATVIGNKYVIAISSEDAWTNFLTVFNKNIANSATNDKIVINSNWDISVTSGYVVSGNETFDENGLKNAVTISSIPNLGTGYSSGQGSKTYIKSSATKETFETLCADMETAGLKKYTSNSIGNNLFATYITQTQIVHVMYFPNKNQIRTAVDKRGEGTNGFALTGLSGENKYMPTEDSKMILCDISNADRTGGMCLIFKLSDGRFFIVDAGIGGLIADGRTNKGSSAGWIYQTLAAHANDPKNIEVAAWLITHPHSDHAGGLYDMALGYYGYEGKKHTVMPKEMKKYIKIDKIIYNAPDKFPDADRTGWMPKIIEAFNVKNVVKAHPGQVLYVADLTLTIYGSLDIMIEKASSSTDLNDFSIVSRAEFNGKTILLMGDSDTIPNPILASIYKESLSSDILQLAHHGYGDVGDHAVNSYCNPDIVIWAVEKEGQRTNCNINMDITISSTLNSTLTARGTNSEGKYYGGLNTEKNYRPGMGNLVFDKDWNTTSMSRSKLLAAIPACDGTHCGSSSCTKKSSGNYYVE